MNSHDPIPVCCWVSIDAVLVEGLSSTGASPFTSQQDSDQADGKGFSFSCAPSVLSTFQISQHGNASARVAVN